MNEYYEYFSAGIDGGEIYEIECAAGYWYADERAADAVRYIMWVLVREHGHDRKSLDEIIHRARHDQKLDWVDIYRLLDESGIEYLAREGIGFLLDDENDYYHI